MQDTFEVGESSKDHGGVIHLDADDLEEKTQGQGDVGIPPKFVEEKVVEQQTKVEEATAG